MIRRFTFIVMIVLLLAKDSSATEVSYNAIKANSYHIQVGAFGSNQNVNHAVNRLSEFNVYVESYKGLNRVIVVNIMTKAQLKRYFSKIKKLYPKAFITKRPLKRKKVTQKHAYKKPVKNYNQLFKSFPQKREIIEQHNNTLNSNTILKTRKSFL